MMTINSLHDGLSGIDAARCKNDPPTHVFSIVTWGCTASQWLSDTLNAHPDIFCVHALNGDWHRFGAAPLLDGPEYLRVLGLSASTVAASGDVHGISRFAIPQCRKVFGERFGCAVLTREPLARLNSLMALYELFSSWSPDFSNSWNTKELSDLISSKMILPDDDLEKRLFVHAVNALNAITEEVEVGRVFRSEDLTSSPEALTALILEITGGRVDPDQEWVTKCLQRPRSNSHVARNKREPEALSSWRIEIIKKFVTAKAWKIYQDIGYDVPEFI